MHIKRSITATAVSLALAGASSSALAEITAVPGEANLVAMFAADQAVGVHTYVALIVPETIGDDTVIELANPNFSGGVFPVAQDFFDPRIHWVMYDERSEKILSGTCEVSPGDIVIWTTDGELQQLQTQQERGLADRNIEAPASVCGPVNYANRNKPVGYIVFQTYTGSRGLDADFSFTAQASIIGTGPINGMVPALPMADGADPLPQGSGTPDIVNSVINQGPYGSPRASDPVKVAPILAGIRMNNSDSIDDFVYMEAPIQGPAAGSGVSAHAFWFDRNDSNRVATLNIWDDQEGVCNDTLPLPRELNLWAYNVSLQQQVVGTAWGRWDANTNIALNQNGEMLDIINLVTGSPNNIKPRAYCEPPYWNPAGVTLPVITDAYPGALLGNVNYQLPEINKPAPIPGLVNSAAVAWNYQQIPGGWSVHLTNDLGKQ